jgi:hypothetical protein
MQLLRQSCSHAVAYTASSYTARAFDLAYENSN